MNTNDGRVSRQDTSTSVARNNEEESSADLFARLAEQFVEQVRAMASIDEQPNNQDGETSLIDPETRKTSKSGSIGKFRLRGIPNRAANRVAEVLQNEFGFSAQEVESLGIVCGSSSSNESNQPRESQSFTRQQSELRPCTSAAAARNESPDRANEVEMPEVENDYEAAESCSDNTSDLSVPLIEDYASKSPIHQVATPSDKPETHATSSIVTPARESEDQSARSATIKSNYQLRKRSSQIWYSEETDSSQDEAAVSDPYDIDADMASEDSSSRHTRARSRSARGQRRRKARTARSPKRGKSSDVTAPDMDDSSGEDLWDETIEQIYQKSASITHFTRNLLFHFFTASELAECYNVYGRSANARKKPSTAGGPLDPKRVNMIRQLVRQKVDLTKEQWKKCVHAMNCSIGRIKSIGYKNTRLEKIDGQGNYKDMVFPKQKPELEKSSIYQENGLSYQEINELYCDSQSLPNFALNLMRHLFTESELRECFNVYGRPKGNSRSIKPRLDEKRVSLIRRIVEENCDYDRYVWQVSVSGMNAIIKKKKANRQRKSRIYPL